MQHLTQKLLKPMIIIQKTRSYFTMNIHVICNFYKLACTFQYLHCSKFFVIGKSIVHLCLHEFVCAMNLMLKIQVKWMDFEEYAIVKNKQSQCLVIVIIHTLRFNTFLFSWFFYVVQIWSSSSLCKY